MSSKQNRKPIRSRIPKLAKRHRRSAVDYVPLKQEILIRKIIIQLASFLPERVATQLPDVELEEVLTALLNNHQAELATYLANEIMLLGPEKLKTKQRNEGFAPWVSDLVLHWGANNNC